jgi:hypothetical protein
VSDKDQKRGSPKDDRSEKAAADELQKNIDALVRGEVPQGPRTLRDLARKPSPGPAIPKDNSNKKPE